MTERRHVRVADIKVDDDYRQEAPATFVAKLQEGWKGSLVGLLVVNERPNGELYILDGRTRLKVLQQMDPEATIDVELTHLAREDEIRAFIDLNTPRRLRREP